MNSRIIRLKDKTVVAMFDEDLVVTIKELDVPGYKVGIDNWDAIDALTAVFGDEFNLVDKDGFVQLQEKSTKTIFNQSGQIVKGSQFNVGGSW